MTVQAYTCMMISVLALNYVIDRCFKKAEQVRDLHFSAFIVISKANIQLGINGSLLL